MGKEYPLGRVVAYAYDKGRVLAMVTHDDVAVQMGYDEAGGVVRVA